MRSFLLGLFVLMCSVFGAAQQVFEVTRFKEDLMIPMRDGVRIATDIYRPMINGLVVEDPKPLLLQRTPYDKKRRGIVESAEYFARNGYVVALQDLRGRFQSEGEFTKYIGEGEDGYDSIEALAKLPYVSGEVGMWGTSYAAHTQANAAKLNPENLTTILVNMGGMENGWDHKVRNNGAFELSQITWAFRNLESETKDPVIKAMLGQESVSDWIQALPFRKGLNPLSAAPNFEDYVLEMMTHSDYDDYWKHLDLNWAEYYDKTADIPMMLVSGWYDSYSGGTVANYVGLSRHLSSPVYLLMGPWTHGGNARSFAGDVEFGTEAAISDFHREFHLRWFDRYLRNSSADLKADEKTVRLFVMGTGDGHRNEEGKLFHGGYWRHATEWPLLDTEWQQYYLHSDGALRTDVPKEDDAPSTYTFDPENPVPTMGGAFSSSGPVFDPGAYHQAESEKFFGSTLPYLPLKARSDILTFQTEPLVSSVEVVGPIVVNLYVASTAVDTDFTVKLVDVYPPSADYPSGFDMNLTDGILRARYRNSPAEQEMMEPGDVYQIQIKPFPTANVFKKGHRIRIEISSSNFPRFDVNPNTGEPLGRHRRTTKADNTVFHDAERKSHVVLPIVPATVER